MQNSHEPEIEQTPEELMQVQKDYLLCLQVLLDDINNSNTLGKSAENSDLTLAAQLVQDECSAWINSFRLASAIEGSGFIPDSLITAFDADNTREKNDREMALRLADPNDRNSAKIRDKNLINAFGKLEIGSKQLVSRQKDPGPSGSFQGPSKNSADLTSKKCISCFESAGHKSTCGHYYCKNCISQLCLNALRDIGLFPVRCCKQNIQQELIESALSAEDLKRYKELQLSISSLSINTLDPDFKAMVVANGWKICPGCGAGIEKTRDCNHMTCLICKFEFCYVCNANWKPRACNCDLWLPAELEAIIDERAPEANALERQRLRNVYREHDVHVHNWQRIRFPANYQTCPTCGWVCNHWYWRCYGCMAISCGTCAFNR